MKIIIIILFFYVFRVCHIYTDDNVDVTSEPVEQEVSVGSPLQHTTNKNHQLEVQLGGTVTLQCPQGSLGCWSHLDPINQRLRGLGIGSSMPTGIYSLKDVVYQDAGTYKCVGQSPTNKKKLDVLHTLSLNVKGKLLLLFFFYFHFLLLNIRFITDPILNCLWV